LIDNGLLWTLANCYIPVYTSYSRLANVCL